ncbi:hypothetical protein [Rhizobium grahamii]|uniref:hypothetical protein n=1 Tax=Rhizobium grahamii TaxID=1120045 RepID=UPI00159EC5C4|nr:hypothetical protein [Rhizobium grahamii]
MGVRLIHDVPRRIYRLRGELRRDDQAAVDAARFGRQLDSLRKSIQLSFSGD